MKKIKLLTPILGLTTLTTSVIPFTTSCKSSESTGDRTNSISLGFQNPVATTSTAFFLEFKLAKEMPSKQELSAYASHAGGSSLLPPSVSVENISGTTVKLKIIWNGLGVGRSTFNVQFTGKTGSTTDWTQESEEIIVVYSQPENI